MSFLDTLDTEGKQLYNDYIVHCNKWINYIRPKAIRKLNDYLDTNKKFFNKYEYLTEQYSDSQHNNKVNKEPSKDITAKYKKLSILFHPDKYNNAHNTELFSLINKIYSNNNIVLINAIDIVAHRILELDNLENIISNLDDSNITTILNNSKTTNDANDANYIFSILNSNGNRNLNENENQFEINNKNYNNPEIFLNSTCYSFYKDNKNTIYHINDQFIMEEEFIEKIRNARTYERDFIDFCFEKYRDNKNIMVALCEWIMRENEELSKANEIMRGNISKPGLNMA